MAVTIGQLAAMKAEYRGIQRLGQRADRGGTDRILEPCSQGEPGLAGGHAQEEHLLQDLG